MVIHVIVAFSLIGIVLIQHGKGADAGAAFGSGASGTVFGSHGSGSFMTRLTAGLATVFFLTSLTLAYLSGQATVATSVVDALEQPATEAVEQIISEEPAATRSDVPALPNPVE